MRKYKFKDVVQMLLEVINDIPPHILDLLEVWDNPLNPDGKTLKYGNTFIEEGDILYWDNERFFVLKITK